MAKFQIREDDWSFQIFSPGSKRFFIRITTDKTNTESMIFSDFTLDPNDTDRALQALRLVKQHFHGPTSGMRIVFQDIHPTDRNGTDYAEIVRRHDQIVDVMKSYADEAGWEIDNIFLEPSGEKFNIVVVAK